MGIWGDRRDGETGTGGAEGRWRQGDEVCSLFFLGFAECRLPKCCTHLLFQESHFLHESICMHSTSEWVPAPFSQPIGTIYLGLHITGLETTRIWEFWSDSTAGKAFTLYMINPDSIPGILHGPLSKPRSDPRVKISP